MNIASLAKTFGEKAKRIRIDVCPTGGGKIRLTLSADPASGSERNAFVPLQADGTPEEIRASRHPVVRQFINGESAGPITDDESMKFGHAK